MNQQVSAVRSEHFSGDSPCGPSCRWLVRLLRPGRTLNGVTYPFAVLYRLAELVAGRPLRVVRVGQELAHPRRSDPVPAHAVAGVIERGWVDEERRVLLGVAHLAHGPNRLRLALQAMERRGLVRTVALSLVPQGVRWAPVPAALVVADVEAVEAVDLVTRPASDASFVRSLGPAE